MLTNMTDKELAHYATTMTDPLLSSPLEVELAKRFSEITEADQSYSEMRRERDEWRNTVRLIHAALTRNDIEEIRRLCA